MDRVRSTQGKDELHTKCFHSRSRALLCGQTDGHWTIMTNPVITFLSLFTKALKYRILRKLSVMVSSGSVWMRVATIGVLFECFK